jgi:copper homeostasis protein CutC
MEIMPGSGLRSNNIAQVASACFSSYHTSASEMRFENDASIMPASYVVAKAEEVRALSSFLTDYVSQFN